MLTIRRGTPDDWSTIAAFNRRLAQETEGIDLDEATVAAGVRAALADSRKARYYVALEQERIIGQLMHTWEWSDWRNGDIWWLQSVYVDSAFRGRGVFRALFEHVHRLAAEDPGVVGIRLYVEEENTVAQEVYRRLGLSRGGYLVMQHLPI